MKPCTTPCTSGSLNVAGAIGGFADAIRACPKLQRLIPYCRSPEIQGPLMMDLTAAVKVLNSSCPGFAGSGSVAQVDPQNSSCTGSPVPMAPPWKLTALDGQVLIPGWMMSNPTGDTPGTDSATAPTMPIGAGRFSRVSFDGVISTMRGAVAVSVLGAMIRSLLSSRPRESGSVLSRRG